MADLTGAPLDPNVKENTGGYTVVPPGNYVAVIVADRVVDTNAKDGKILELKVQIADGQYKGETIIDRLNIVNKSPVAQNIGQGQLKHICAICGVQYPPANTDGLIGRPMQIKVVNESFKSNTTGEDLTSNKIKGYNTIVSATPKPATNNNTGW